jgi:hypothetical protein
LKIALLLLTLSLPVWAQDEHIQTLTPVNSSQTLVPEEETEESRLESVHVPNGINFFELYEPLPMKLFGKQLVFDGHIYGFEEGTVGSVGFLLPIKFKKSLKVSPGLVGVIGKFESIVGAAAHVEAKKGPFIFDWAMILYYKNGHWRAICDPCNTGLEPFTRLAWLPKPIRNAAVEFSWARATGYGPDGHHHDNLYGLETEVPMTHHFSAIGGYMPQIRTPYFGIAWRSKGNLEHH